MQDAATIHADRCVVANMVLGLYAVPPCAGLLLADSVVSAMVLSLHAMAVLALFIGNGLIVDRFGDYPRAIPAGFIASGVGAGVILLEGVLLFALAPAFAPGFVGRILGVFLVPLACGALLGALIAHFRYRRCYLERGWAVAAQPQFRQ